MARILVVDDDATNLALAFAVLELAGHDVLSASSGMEALATAQAKAPDLILMDVQMPGIDGLTALRRLRAESSTATVKVVALTALAIIGDRERLLAEGFDGYIEKPIRYKEFLACIATLLRDTSE